MGVLPVGKKEGKRILWYLKTQSPSACLLFWLAQYLVFSKLSFSDYETVSETVWWNKKKLFLKDVFLCVWRIFLSFIWWENQAHLFLKCLCNRLLLLLSLLYNFLLLLQILAEASNTFFHLKSNYSLFPRWSHNFLISYFSLIWRPQLRILCFEGVVNFNAIL